jgi:hypothetical protein
VKFFLRRRGVSARQSPDKSAFDEALNKGFVNLNPQIMASMVNIH